MHEDEKLGLTRRICRRDFLNASLLASGSALLQGLSPQELMAQQDPWDGYSGVGDYRNCNGNPESVIKAAHGIRDNRYDFSTLQPMDTGETFDCVVVGGGISGLGAAHYFHKYRPQGSCLVLDNHPVFGGEAKRNEFIVEGQRLMAQQGPNYFWREPKNSDKEEFFRSIHLDFEAFKHYQTWDPKFKKLEFDHTNYDHMEAQHLRPSCYGYFFGRKFNLNPGKWITGAWQNGFADSPLSPKVRADLDTLWNSNRRPSELQGEALNRWLDSISYEEFLTKTMGVGSDVIRLFIDPMVGAAMSGTSASAVSAWPRFLPGYQGFLTPEEREADRQDTLDNHLNFPGGLDGIGRLMVKELIPEAFAGAATTADVTLSPINFGALDHRGNPVRIRVNSLVIRVENAPGNRLLVTYLNGGKFYRVKARIAVAAGGAWTTRRIVQDLPAEHVRCLTAIYSAPMMVANVALRNWKFMYKLGLSGGFWFEGFGFATNIRPVVQFASPQPQLDPDSPTVLTFYVPLYSPGLPGREQTVKGKMELLNTSYRDYELRIRKQLAEMFSQAGFDPARDIAGIILNRWGHAYVVPWPGFFVSRNGKPTVANYVRQNPFGRVAFAHSDLTGLQDHWGAVKEARRAVEQLLEVNKES